jgi:hypothetical protein
MLFSKYRAESAGGRRHRPGSSEGSGLPHAPGTSQVGPTGHGPFPSSPPYLPPQVQAAAPSQRYPGSVPRHQLSVSPTQSRAVPGGPPLLSYHPDARGPPGTMVLTFDQGKLSSSCLRSCDFLLLLPLASPHYPSSPFFFADLN